MTPKHKHKAGTGGDPDNDFFFDQFKNSHINVDVAGTMIVFSTLFFCTVFVLSHLGVI